MKTIDMQLQEKLGNQTGFKPIKRLYLNGSGKVIAPYPYDNKKSWLEDCQEVYKTTNIDRDALNAIAQDLGIATIHGELRGEQTLFTEDKELDEDRCECFPVAVYGRVEPGGALSVMAFFEDGQEGQIVRTECATVTNYDVDWINNPFLPTPTCKCSCTPTHDANQ